MNTPAAGNFTTRVGAQLHHDARIAQLSRRSTADSERENIRLQSASKEELVALIGRLDRLSRFKGCCKGRCAAQDPNFDERCPSTHEFGCCSCANELRDMVEHPKPDRQATALDFRLLPSGEILVPSVEISWPA
jgi:hypothetical protein